MVSSFLRVGKKKTGHCYAIGQVHGHEVVIRDAVPEKGIAAKRRKGNYSSSWDGIGLAAHTGADSYDFIEPPAGSPRQSATSHSLGYSCALTKLGSFRECHR